MLRSANALMKYAVQGTDGEIGSVHDFYFDDASWRVRYLVVDTGTLLPGQRVLIPSSGLKEPQWAERVFPVDLTREQIKGSPTIDQDKPVSRQEEEAIHTQFNWAPYWTATGFGTMAHPAVVPVGVDDRSDPELEKSKGDPHLRSLSEITGYAVEAKDGEIGHIEDFIFDDDDWQVRMVVVDTRNWLPGKSVLLAIEWIYRFDWASRKAVFDLNKETIEGAPAYNPAEPINKQAEVRLYDYYGRPTSYVVR